MSLPREVAVGPTKRPCRICRRWFEPHPRAGDRQHVCSDEACQRERHRRSDRAWHARNPDYDRKRRLARRLGEEPVVDAAEDPLEAMDWSVAEAEIGSAHRVVAERTGRLLVAWAQDAVGAKREGPTGDLDPLPRRSAQDAVGAKAAVRTPNPDPLPSDPRKTQSDRGPPSP